jgi:hypothetical protein
VAKIGYKATSGKSPLPEDLLVKGKRSTLQYFISLIDQGKFSGEIRPDIDSEIAAFIFVSALSEMGNFVAAHPQMELDSTISGSPTPAQLAEIKRIYQQIILILKNGMAD